MYVKKCKEERTFRHVDFYAECPLLAGRVRSPGMCFQLIDDRTVIYKALSGTVNLVTIEERVG